MNESRLINQKPDLASEGKNSRKKIDEGKYRDVYALGVAQEKIAKVLKKTRGKQYFKKEVQYPMELYTALKFGIRNFNQYEFDVIKKLPHEFQAYLPKNMRLINDVLVMDRLKDFDGEWSKNMEDVSKIDNGSFWEHIESIRDLMIKNDLYFMDVFSGGKNVVVQKNTKDEWSPVLVDLKRLGSKTYPAQINLRFKGERHKKFLRRFENFENKFKAI